MKRLKNRCLTVLLSIFILINSIFVPALNVQAAELTYTLSALEALLSLFGLEIGLGNQSEFFTNSEFTDFVNAVANGETVTLSPYGEVNFSDGESILAFMTWASALTYSAADGNVLNAARILDSTSYKTSGTSATSAMEQKISNYVGDYNGSSEALAEDVQSTFRVITGGGSGSGSSDDNDDDEDKKMSSERWKTFGVIISSFLFGAAGKYCDYLDTLNTPEETGFTEYSTAFEELPEQYFNGEYTTDSSGNYIYNVYSASEKTYRVTENASLSCKIVAVKTTTDLAYVYSLSSSGSELIQVSLPFTSYYSDGSYLGSGSTPSVSLAYGDNPFVYRINFPLYSTREVALAALQNDDFSDAENLLDDSAYPTFRKTAPTATSTLSNTINKWMDTNPAIDNFPAAVSDILNTSDTVAGTSDAVPAVDTAIAETAGVESDSDSAADDDSDSGTDTSTNYMGILGKILSVLQSILNSILGKIASLLQSILDAIISIKTFLVELLEAAFVPDLDYWEAELDARVDSLEERTSILTLPLSIIVLVMDVITDSEGIGDFILTIPMLEYKGYVLYEGYSFNVSEFVRQDMWSTIYNMYILITDIIIVCYIANYGRKKFAAIILGESR